MLALISLVAGDHQPVPVPAARRRPHLLGAGREGPRAARSRSASWSAPAFVGFVLVMVLFVIGLTNDIGELQDGGFGVAVASRPWRGDAAGDRRARSTRRRSPRRSGSPVADHPDRVAIRTKDDEVSLTWGELRDARRRARRRPARRWACARGDTVALMLGNRPEFHLADLAAMTLGATPFSIYLTSAPEQIAYVVGDAGARVAIVEAAVRRRSRWPRSCRARARDRGRRRARDDALASRGADGLRLRGRLARRRARRHPHADLHLGHHRAAEGRAAHPPQHDGRGALHVDEHDRVPRRRARDLLAAEGPHRRARRAPLPADRLRR